VVPALMLLGLDAHRRRSGALAGAAALGALVALAHVIWWVPVNRPRHSELHLGAAQLLYADAYVLIAVLALALAGLSELRRAGVGARAGSRSWPSRTWRESGVGAG
jgi:hypothetical protein